jgi:hypothetical protein
MSGNKIIEGLKDAVAGNLSRVTIDGQIWTRTDNDNVIPIPAVTRDEPSPEFSRLDIEALFNLREWVSEALKAKGAKVVGAGIGCGGTMGIADIQIEMDGHQCNIEIRPL